MARVKISEYKAKQLLYKDLGLSPTIVSFNLNNDSESKFDSLNESAKYIVKVDQGVKGRFKKGLVALNKTLDEVKDTIKDLQKQGYSSFIIEEYIPHKKTSELYISIERIRQGKLILYSRQGGIEIEKNKKNVEQLILREKEDINKVSDELGINEKALTNILEIFDKYYFSFLEINPLVSENNNYHILDLAVEVDSTAEFFVDNSFSSSDFVRDIKEKTKEEEEIEKLSQKSQAAFKLDLINPNGSIFMLLSGGGASIVLADEVYNQGFSKELANYGEYSGNPNEEETYIYTKNLLSLLIKSNASKKVLIIAGGVANFTDIRITFKGIIRALSAVSPKLKKNKVKVFVRRGGPHQKEGLELMEKFLEKEGLLGIVSEPKMVLTEIILLALSYLKK